ncbi:Hypothetical_protein [Hexamita inflata]|uniref:Hypothetical_protein n=1 Tax=Hexamita inflata TaxID=28002 RepID=A0AA86UCA4_9EUKA|nr:Hypothetical protein HINF_LOCUS33077 [Hexamita inflata]
MNIIKILNQTTSQLSKVKKFVESNASFKVDCQKDMNYVQENHNYSFINQLPSMNHLCISALRQILAKNIFSFQHGSLASLTTHSNQQLNINTSFSSDEEMNTEIEIEYSEPHGKDWM